MGWLLAGFEPGAVQPGGRRAGCKANSPRQTVVNLGSSIKAYYSTSREYRIDASCSKGDALALLDVRLREYTEKGLDGHNLEKLRDYVAETY